MNGRAGWLVSLAAGLALWIAATIAEGTAEPWDRSAYWTFYLPLAFILCLVLGALFPERAWRWPVAVMLAQLPVMLVASGEVGGLLVMGVVLLLILSLPGMLLAMIGAGIRKWLTA